MASPATRSASESRLLDALAFVFGVERGFSNDPKDPGGPTNFGMSLRQVLRFDADKQLRPFLRAKLDVDGDGDIDIDDVKGWTREVAIEFYQTLYWDAVRADDLPWPLSLVVFDAAVNQGQRLAIDILQRIGGVMRDGIIGPNTILAARETMRRIPGEVITRAISLRLDHYRTLADAPEFFLGWAARSLNLRVKCASEGV